MKSHNETLRALQDALLLSPDNLPLRQHFAETLLSHGEAAEAEKEFRETLKQAPDSVPLKLGLAQAFFQQGKNSAALVVVEDLLQSEKAPGRAYLLYARLLLKTREPAPAQQAYQQAIKIDPTLADPSLAEQLGVRPENVEKRDAASDDDLLLAPVEYPAEAPITEVEHPEINFAGVGGMEKVKDEIRMKIIHPLTHPEIYKAYGKAVGGGILMYGPPGCGKTYLARATAGEVKAGFLAVGIHDVLQMYIGQSERNLHEIFEHTRSHQPCVLFFDEVDALGASRTDMRQSGGRQLINQFLAELDGVQSSNAGVLILAATNAPWHLDSAFRRPGRFDRIIFVPPPDVAARAAILRILLKGKPAMDVDYDYLSKKTEEFSGADLKAVVDLAVEEKLREAMKKGAPSPIATKELMAAVKTLRPTTKEWFATARNYALYSNQGGIYDDIIAYMKL